MTKITLIAAMSLNGVIGNGNDIPWNCREDMKHFKETTMGHVVIMGRKTFESMRSISLSNRINIVVSRKETTVHSTDGQDYSGATPSSFSDMFATTRTIYPDKKIFVIGGGEIYRQTIDIADRLIISHIHKPVQGDVKFPDIDLNKWMVEKIDHRLTGEIPFTIVHYIK